MDAAARRTVRPFKSGVNKGFLAGREASPSEGQRINGRSLALDVGGGAQPFNVTPGYLEPLCIERQCQHFAAKYCTCPAWKYAQ